MKSKKGVELALQTIVVAILVLIVLIISIVVYTKYINRGADQIDIGLSRLDDYDSDDLADFFDSCPCDFENTNPCATDKEDCAEKLKK